jgi:hypothetical protein
MRIKRYHEEMLRAKQRDQLIEKELVTKQLAFLVVAMHQKLMILPSKVGNHFGDRAMPMREIVAYSQRLMHEVLTELSRFPEAAEPNWLERLEEEEQEGVRRKSGKTLASNRCY